MTMTPTAPTATYPGVLVPNRAAAFQTLGTEVAPGMTAHGVLTSTGLAGWNVRTAPLLAQATDSEGFPAMVPIPNQHAVVRDNPLTGQIDHFGVVGNQWQPYQNEQTCAFLDAIAGEAGGTFNAAGEIRGGRTVFVSMKLPDVMRVGGIDPIDLYLVAFNAHDGNGSFKLAVTPVRVFCANQQAAIVGRGKRGVFSVAHRTNLEENVEQARHDVASAIDYIRLFGTQAERMVNTRLNDGQFRNLMGQLFNAPRADEDASPKRVSAWEAISRDLDYLWFESVTNAEIRGTTWGAYQVITEYADHFAATRGHADVEARRAERTMSDGAMVDLKHSAYTKCLELALTS